MQNRHVAMLTNEHVNISEGFPTRTAEIAPQITSGHSLEGVIDVTPDTGSL